MYFNDEPRRQLKTLYERYGVDLFRPRDRAWGLLADLCAGRRAENFLLGSVAREGLVELVMQKGYTGPAAVTALAQRVKTDLGLDDERASWVASAWGEACGWLSSSGKTKAPEQIVRPNGSHSGFGGLVESVVRGFGYVIGDVRLRDKLPDDAVATFATQCAGDPAEEIFAAVLWPSVSGSRGVLLGELGLRFRNPEDAIQPGPHHLTYEDMRVLPRPSNGNSAVAWGESIILSTAGTGIPSSSIATFLNVIREVVASRVE